MTHMFAQGRTWLGDTLISAGSVTRILQVAALAFFLNCIGSQVAPAQVASLPQPEFSMLDTNDVDLLTFYPSFHVTDVSIGDAVHPLTDTQYGIPAIYSGIYNDFIPGNIYWAPGVTHATCNPLTPPYVTVYFGHSTELFQGCVTFVSQDFLKSSTLAYNPDGTYTYTLRDGTAILYTSDHLPDQAAAGLLSVTYPDGRVLSYGYVAGTGQLASLTRSDGLQLHFTYTTLASGAVVLSSTTAINNAFEYCSPTANTCALTKAWPKATYTNAITSMSPAVVGAVTITDAASGMTRYTLNSDGTLAVKLPSSASADNIVYTPCGTSGCPQYAFESVWFSNWHGYVLSVTRDGQVWNYVGVPGSPGNNVCGNGSYTVYNPAGGVQQAQLYNCVPGTSATLGVGCSPLKQFTNVDGVVFVTPCGSVQTATRPEGDQTTYGWGARGNLTSETLASKPSLPAGSITLSANYDSTCTNVVKCNKPNWIRDGNGNQTDYTYDPAHGGLLTETKPADAHGIRPQTRYTYVQRYAWVLNASGTYVKSAVPIWVLATKSYCRTKPAASPGPGCTVASDEVVTTYDYGPDSGPNNLLLRGLAVTADGVTHRTCYGNDIYGNRISETSADAGRSSCP